MSTPPPLSDLARGRSATAVILIHGAWQGAWARAALLPHLERRGLQALAVDLPGNGVDGRAPGDVTVTDCIDHVRDLALAQPGPVALVGHSGGGMIATAVAEAIADRISHVVYVAGMLLPRGDSFDDVQQRIAGPGGSFGVSPHIEIARDGMSSTVPRAAALEFFFHDCPPAAAEDAATRLTAQPAATHRMRTPTTGRFAALPKLYIECTADRSVIPPAQRMMQAGVSNLRSAQIACGHCPQLAKPAALARTIAGFVRPAATSARRRAG